MPTKVRDAIRQIQEIGWYLGRQKGSHRQFVHDERPGVVTIAGKDGDDIAPGTYSSILRQAGIK